MVCHLQRPMPHLALDIQRASPHRQLSRRHVTAAVVRGNPLAIDTCPLFEPEKETLNSMYRDRFTRPRKENRIFLTR